MCIWRTRKQPRLRRVSYGSDKGGYTCVNRKGVPVIGTGTRTSAGGYKAETTIHECESFQGCPVKEQCTKTKGNRQRRRNCGNRHSLSHDRGCPC
ncbi:MAG: transposase [Spirochaetaceae bacterium]|nr:transposase [Spirochaetaceae bacterium]